MCDTLYKKTPSGFIFGKNSDRSPNEPNLTLFYPRRKTTEKMLRCTYIEIPQVPETYAALLVQPSWMWGAEMGINEFGVVIGNEAVFTKNKDKKEERLLGMDLLRLGLERGKTAKEALNIIIALLEEYGQGGNCGFDKPFYYDNSFLIIDDEEAYVLETAAKDWVYRKIDNCYNISNRLSLNDNYTAYSQNIPAFASKNSDFLFTHFSGSKLREKGASVCLQKESFRLEDMFAALRTHYPKDEKTLFTKGSVRSVCMHKSLLGDHTTGSMVVEKVGERRLIWITGTSTPCLAVFKPVVFSLVVPPVFSEKEKSLEYWLDREYLNRALYARLIDVEKYKQEKENLEAEFLSEAKNLDDSEDKVRNFVVSSFIKEQELIDKYRQEIDYLKKNPKIVPKLWRKPTEWLGKNVFESNLKGRIER
ncbi:MAG TPA: C69 family dipeptidase [Bacilli bacterium]